jgi:hypothetical protein
MPATWLGPALCAPFLLSEKARPRPGLPVFLFSESPVVYYLMALASSHRPRTKG